MEEPNKDVLETLHKQALTIAISLSPVNELFDRNEENNYNLKSPSDFSLTIVKTMLSGVEALLYLVRKIREIVPPEMKKVDSLLEFENQIKLWNRISCSCRICKRYINNLKFM